MAISDGARFPSSMGKSHHGSDSKRDGANFCSSARLVGAPKAFKWEEYGQHEESWELGLTSMYCETLARSTSLILVVRDYDDHGPAGPSAMWKLSDRLIDPRSIDDLPDLFQ
jgi:hypothetical protein